MKMFYSVQIIVILKIISSVMGSYYANNYPYIAGHELSNAAGGGSADTHGSVATNAFTKNQAHDQGNDLYANHEGVKFFNKINDEKGHDINRLKVGSSVDDQRHVVGQNVENDNSHNRKSVKSGFHNTYSKDESGSNSSYYEDSDDHGGKLIYDKRHGTKGDAHDAKYKEHVRDGSVRDRGDDRYGGYNTRGSQDRQHLIEQDKGNQLGHRDQYNNGRGERFEVYNERPLTHQNGYYKPEPLNYRRPIDYQTGYLGYNNGHSPRLSNNNNHNNHLPPLPLPLPLNRGQDDGYFSRQRITIYDDPRELIDPRRISAERRGGSSPYSSSVNNIGDGIYHSPRLDVRPSPLRFRDYYDERDNLRYRDY